MARERFLMEMEARLRDFDEKLARLAAHPRPSGERAGAERDKTYFCLKAKRDELREQLTRATAAPDDGWHPFRDAAERVYNDMVRYMDEACARIDGPENAGLY